METQFKKQTITRQRVLDVLAEFRSKHPDTNDYDEWLDKGTYKYVLIYEERMYPPKYILSEASGIPAKKILGGTETNYVFLKLGFEIAEKNS